MRSPGSTVCMGSSECGCASLGSQNDKRHEASSARSDDNAMRAATVRNKRPSAATASLQTLIAEVAMEEVERRPTRWRFTELSGCDARRLDVYVGLRRERKDVEDYYGGNSIECE